MAITAIPRFDLITPAYNSAIFTIDSTQTAQPNFLYTIELTDMETGLNQRVNVPKPFIGTEITFDISIFARAFIKNQLLALDPNPLTVFRTYNHVRKVQVRIGEIYGTPPVTYDGAAQFYQFWNAGLTSTDYKDFVSSDKIFFSDNDFTEILSNTLPEDVHEGYSSFIQLVNYNSAKFAQLIITTFDANGNTLGSSTLSNPYVGDGNYLNSYLTVDVGPRALRHYGAGAVTGTYPILPAGTVAYTVAVAWYDSGNNYKTQQKKLYNIVCEPVFDVWVFHYLARSGAFDTAVFSKQSYLTSEADRKQYGVYSIDKSANYQAQTITRSLDTVVDLSVTANTPPLKDEYILKYAELSTSPLIYLDQGVNGLREVLRDGNSYRITKRFNTKRRSIQMTFKIANAEGRQY